MSTLTDLIQSLRTNTIFRELCLELEDEFVFARSHTPGDPYDTAYREGQRSIAKIFSSRQMEIEAKWRKKEAAKIKAA